MCLNSKTSRSCPNVKGSLSHSAFLIGSIEKWYEMRLQSGSDVTRQVTLNKLASPHRHQTSEAVRIHTPRGTDVSAAGTGCGDELKKNKTKAKNVWNWASLASSWLQKCWDAVWAAAERWMRFSWWISWASAGSRSFSWATMKTWLEGGGGAAAGMGLLPHGQISHSIQAFYPTGTFTWLSLWSASSSSASSPSSFAPVAELPPKKTTEERFHPQLLRLCLKGSLSFQTKGPVPDLHATLPLWVLLIHDPLLLSPLLLLPAGLGRLLALSVRLLQEVLLHASSVPVGLLFALKAERRKQTCCCAFPLRAQRSRERPSAAHLSVETQLLDFVDAVDHHVHEGEQRVHVFGRRVAHAGHYTQKRDAV